MDAFQISGWKAADKYIRRIGMHVHRDAVM